MKNKIDKLLSQIIDKADGDGKFRDIYDPIVSKYIKEYEIINEILDNSNKIWLGSDWHLWGKGNYVHKHINKIIYNQIRMVDHNDAFIYLGDLQHRNSTQDNLQQKITNVISRLTGKKIMVLGNHDIQPKQFYLDSGFDFVCEGFIWRDLVFTHVPIHHTNFKGAKLNIHGHTHEFTYQWLLLNKYKKVHTDSNNYEPILLEDLLRS